MIGPPTGLRIAYAGRPRYRIAIAPARRRRNSPWPTPNATTAMARSFLLLARAHRPEPDDPDHPLDHSDGAVDPYPVDFAPHRFGPDDRPAPAGLCRPR